MTAPQIDEELRAWQQAAARVALHPSWPLPIELFAVSPRGDLTLQCVVHTYDAQDHEVPLADLYKLDVCFTYDITKIRQWHAHDRVRFVIDCVRKTVLHELDEFLLVDGQVAQSPHLTEQRRFSSELLERSDNIRAWQAAIDRISLHLAWNVDLKLTITEPRHPRHPPVITCALRPLDNGGVFTLAALTALSRTMSEQGPDHVQQLLMLIRNAVQRFFDGCLLVDGVRVLEESVSPNAVHS